MTYSVEISFMVATVDEAFEHQEVLSVLAKTCAGKFTGGGMMVSQDSQKWRDCEFEFQTKQDADGFVAEATRVTAVYTLMVKPTDLELN